MNEMSGVPDSFDDDPELRQRIREADITRPRLSALKSPEVNGHAVDDLPTVDFGVNGGAYEPDVPPADRLSEQAKAAEQISEPKKTLQALTAQLLQSSAQFIEGFIPPDYVLDGILQRRFVYSLTGRTGSGKTAIVLLIAASVASGRSIGAHELQTGRVLYFAGENPDDIRMRWIAMAQHMDFDVNEIEVCFIPGTFKISEIAAQVALEAKQPVRSCWSSSTPAQRISKATTRTTTRKPVRTRDGFAAWSACRAIPASSSIVIRRRMPATTTCSRAAVAPTSRKWTAT